LLTVNAPHLLIAGFWKGLQRNRFSLRELACGVDARQKEPAAA
jgi:hypothetical protein